MPDDTGLKYFPLIIDRWLAGTRLLGDTPDENLYLKGAYLELLIYLYEGRGRVIKDHKHVSRILGIHANKGRKIWDKLGVKFVRNQHGYTHTLVGQLLRNGGKVKGLNGSAYPIAEPCGFASSSSTSTSIKENPLSSREVKRKAASRFSPPTVDEVRDYIREKNYRVDAERFVSFYESKGWMVGRNPMKSWKAAVAGWESRSEPSAKQSAASRFMENLKNA